MQCFSIGATNAVLSSCWRVCGCRQAGVIPVTTKAFWPQQSTWNSKYREFGSCYSLLHCLPPWTPTSDVCRQYDVIPVTTKPFLPKKTFVLCLLYSKASTTRLCNTSDNQGILAWTRKDPLKLIYQVTFPMKWKSHLKMSMFDLSARWFQIAGVGADLFFFKAHTANYEKRKYNKLGSLSFFLNSVHHQWCLASSCILNHIYTHCCYLMQHQRLRNNYK